MVNDSMRLSQLLGSLLLFAGLVLFAGCNKNNITDNPNDRLAFSTDTLTFDTVFSSLGSSTRLMKIYNPNNQRIRISNIRLAGGNASPFRINVDGISGTQFTNLEIAANDSMYLFAEVTIDPGNVDNPFWIVDSVVMETNGNIQSVLLGAYGQDAYFYRFDELCNTTWRNDKPHVILGNILVDTNCTLTITEGARIYVANNASLLVAGTLNVLGTADSVVTFEGLRLESFFDDLPGQWGQIIILRGSAQNTLQHARISESTSGIVIGSMVSDNLADFGVANLPDVSLKQVEIRQARDYGIFSFYADVSAENTLINGCGRNNVAALFGGRHTYTHCTLVNYGAIGIDHKLPIVRLSNYALQSETDIRVRPVEVAFRNSIIYGNLPGDASTSFGEIEIDTLPAPTPVDYVFDHCLLRTFLDVQPPEFIQVTANAEPRFEDILAEDFALRDDSPALDRGAAAYYLPTDLYGNDRQGHLDLGAIKRVE